MTLLRLHLFWALVTCFLFPCFSVDVFSAEHGFEIAGVVIHVGEDEPGVPAMPFGHTVSPFTPVSGSFVYESNTMDLYSIDGCDCTGYRHSQINGFQGSFVAFEVQADEYVVEVRNNIEVFGLGLSDMISWIYPGIVGPDLDTPLLVNGIPYDNGLLRVDLVAPNTLFNDSSLPTDIDPGNFLLFASINTLGDEIPLGQPDVLFVLQSLEEVPLLESDHDLDGDVDGRDFLIWQRYSDTDNGNGDANSDIVVDGYDLEIWHAQYNSNVFPVSVATVVPEPSGVMLMSCIILIFLKRRAFIHA